MCSYASGPGGKNFRAQLALNIFQDLNSEANKDEDILKFAIALELHHLYTLIHDDLPCMDNDDYRRGKLSLHKKFGEFQAVLIGDGLSLLSIRALSEMKSFKAIKLIQWCTKLCGLQGLIYGQYLDLTAPSKTEFKQHLLINELKTSRLMQLTCI